MQEGQARGSHKGGGERQAVTVSEVPGVGFGVVGVGAQPNSESRGTGSGTGVFCNHDSEGWRRHNVNVSTGLPQQDEGEADSLRAGSREGSATKEKRLAKG